jgi:hypothetical protein
MYGGPPPDGEWNYIVDDHSITFGPGWWPYYRDGKPGTVRMSPDTEFRSWRNEYILTRPRRSEPAQAVARLHLYVRPQGMGAMTVAAQLVIDIRQHTVALPDGLPEHLCEQAATKGQRLLDRILADRRHRRRGAAGPHTAYDRANREPS